MIQTIEHPVLGQLSSTVNNPKGIADKQIFISREFEFATFEGVHIYVEVENDAIHDEQIEYLKYIEKKFPTILDKIDAFIQNIFLDEEGEAISELYCFEDDFRSVFQLSCLFIPVNIYQYTKWSMSFIHQEEYPMVNVYFKGEDIDEIEIE